MDAVEEVVQTKHLSLELVSSKKVIYINGFELLLLEIYWDLIVFLHIHFDFMSR